MLALIFIIPILFTILDYKYDKKILSPIKMFDIIWVVILAAYNLHLSNWQSNFNDRTLLLLLISIVTFNITAFVFLRVKDFNFKQILKKETKFAIDKKLKVVNIGFIVLVIFECIYCKGFPLLSALKHEGYSYLFWGIPTFNGLLYSIAITLGTYYVVKKNPRALIYIGFAIMVISRQIVISIVIQALIVNLCLNIGKKINWKKYAALILVVIIGFSLVGNFRSGNDSMNIVFNPTETAKELPDTIKWVYSYTEFGFNNLNRLTEVTEGGIGFGRETLNYVLPTVIARAINIPSTNINYLVYVSYNTSTCYDLIYIDFGLVGIAIFSMIVGFVGVRLYKRVLKNNNIMNSMWYGIYMHNMLLFFFVNMFLQITIMAGFLIVVLLLKEDEKNENEQ